MVKHILLALSLCLAPTAAFAADFTATVDSTRVEEGQPFTLDLSVSGATAQGEPHLSALQRDFIVAGEGQTSSTSIINGTVSSSSGWELSLIAKGHGRMTVPALVLDTDKGQLSTAAIALDVEPGAPGAQASPPYQSFVRTALRGRASASSEAGVTVTAMASTAHPYKGQAVRYTVTVIAPEGVTDLGLQDLKLDGATVSKPDKPQVADVVLNGEPVKRIRYDFVLTPLQSGRLDIPAPVV